MIKANFNSYSSYITDSVYQWDINQELTINGLNLAVVPEIHFSNSNMDKAIVKHATSENNIIKVMIPNSLLQDALTIYAHVGIYEDSTFKVIEVIEIPVIAKTRPSDYQIEDSDEEIYSFKELKNAIANMISAKNFESEKAKITARIDNIISHNNDTNGNTELIDIRTGADGKIYPSAGESIREQFNKICEVHNVEFSVSGYYGGSPASGKVEILPSAVHYSTPPIKLSECVSIKYSGSMGGTVATWLDEHKQVISQSVDSFDVTLSDVEIKPYAPDNAEYVVLGSRSLDNPTPPTKTPAVTVVNLITINKNDVIVTKVIPLVFYGYWALQTREFMSSNTNISTDYIALDNVSSILYSGSMGGEVASWFDEDKSLIAQTTQSNETTLIDYDIMKDYVAGAKYVVLASRTLNHTVPPSIGPKVSIEITDVSRLYNDDNVINFIGDGVTDETTELQKAFNMSEVNLPCNAKILISKPITVNSEIVKKIKGNNATIIVNGDFTALKVTGKCVGNANPNYTDTKVITNESNTLIENLRFTATDDTQGTAIELSGCFKTIINNCNIFKMKNGIKLVNYNRDLIISNNQIYALYNYGIWFTNSCNNHQLNLVGNHISYCKYCIYYDNCIEIANHQLTGNDIEISDFPDDFKTITRALMIVSGDSNSGQLSEFEIVGNTIQGHYTSDTLIEILGGTNRNIRDMSIVGNHISNSNKNAIVLDRVKNIIIDSNTHKETTEQLFKVTKAINITITSNVSDQCGGLLEATACDIDNLVLANNTVECSNNATAINIPNGTLNNAVISGNLLNVSDGLILITPTTVSKALVFGNLLQSGTYNLADEISSFNNY